MNDRLNKVWSVFSPTVSLMTEIGLLVVWGFGIWLVAHDTITVGVLTAFIAYISRFYARLDSMSRIVSVTQKAAAGAKRIFDILDHVSSVPEPLRPTRMPKLSGRIELREVAFRYGSRSVIRGVNLTVNPGEMIGLVGHSGSGKSTLVNLMCRFYDVSAGAILADGVDLRSMAVADYRANIGLVLQEPFLFFGTIAENIAYGKPGAGRDEIVAAARAAHAHEFILRLPRATIHWSASEDRGSRGERQRISIARALLIDPRILILDEATSSVDTETEKEIQKALDNLVRGRTTIAIAHRLSTLRKADRLVVMDRGRIVEIGCHEELLERRGAYFRLYEAQARQVDEEPVIMPCQSRPRRHPDASSQCFGNIAATRCAWPVGAGSFGRECSSRCGAGSGISACRAARGCGTCQRLRPGALLDREPGRAACRDRLADRGRPCAARFHAAYLAPGCRFDVRHAKQLAGRDRPWATSFVLKAEEDIRRVDASRLVITDRHGIQYQIEDQQALDAISRKLLDRFL